MTGQPGNASNKLNCPRGFSIDWSNTLYIADQYNHRIQKYLKDASYGETVAGDATGMHGNASNRLSHPCDVIVGSNSEIYIADAFNHRVQLWNQNAMNGTTIAGTTGIAGDALDQFQIPYGIAHDPVENAIYVADTGNNRVMYYRVGIKNGTIVAGNSTGGMNAAQLNGALGIYFDEISKSMFIANYLGNNVVRWTLGASNWTLIAGDFNGASGQTANRFNQSTDVILDPMGNVYVTDGSNNRVQFFLANEYESNGTTIASLLNFPISLVLDSQLNLYVSDWLNHRVQKYLRY